MSSSFLEWEWRIFFSDLIPSENPACEVIVELAADL